MQYLLDTCAVSELIAHTPNERVLNYLGSLAEDQIAISVLTIGELRKGVEKLAHSRRRANLEQWLSAELIPRFANRVLAIDVAVANRWGVLVATNEVKGRVLPTIDSLVAATALVHGMKLVTRNEDDFDGTGVEIVNPWR